jgi:hypothetical protein
MDENWKHVFGRLDNLEAELAELREVTWPVCQGIIDKETGPFQNIKNKRRFFKFLDMDEIRKLLRAKAKFMGICQDLIYEELRQVRVEIPRVGEV